MPSDAPQLTHRPQRYIYFWAALSIVLVIALGGVTLAWASSRKSNSTADCVNTTLATRNAPANAEIDAQISKAKADLAALRKIRTQPTAGFSDYTAAAERFVTQMQAVQDTRNAHPLGNC